MNIGEIAEKFIRAAEVERASREHVGPKPLRAQALPYVHTYADKAGWRKEPGDKLEKGADPLAEERKAFWERLGMMPTAQELAELNGLYDLLMVVENDGQRRALLAWARSKVGGKSFRRWCFEVEGIHPETGRRRKDRALTRISAHLARSSVQNCDNGQSPLLQGGPEISHLPDTVEEDVGRRDGLNNWVADDAFTSSSLIRNTISAGLRSGTSSGASETPRKRRTRRLEVDAAATPVHIADVQCVPVRG